MDKNIEDVIIMDKKEIAIAFLRLASSGNVRKAYEKYIHEDFIHHNPYFLGDRKSLLEGMEKNAREFPNKMFNVIRALVDGDLVAIHSSVRLKCDMPEIALVHIFRFEGDRIIEEWEVAQEVPREIPNKNGIF